MRSYSAWKRLPDTAWLRPTVAVAVVALFLPASAGGVVRSAPGGHSLALTCSDDVTTPGTLPSRRVVLRRVPRYYDPLGLPLRTPDFAFGLYGRALPRRTAAQTGLSCSALLLVHVLRPIPRRDPLQRSGTPAEDLAFAVT